MPQFSCLTGRCINISKVDYCAVDCDYTSCFIAVQFPCEIPQFSCLTGQCINMSKVDDDEVDCDDASDEGN